MYPAGFQPATAMPEPLVASNHDCRAFLSAPEPNLPQKAADVC